MNPPRGMRDILPADKARRERVLAVIRDRYPVSYTHLTLPTIYSV